MKPTHQRARINSDVRVAGGFEVWVELGAPTEMRVPVCPTEAGKLDVHRATMIADQKVVRSNVYAADAPDGRMVLPIGILELLPEFDENPAPLEYAEWLASEKRRLGLGGVPS